MKKSDALFQRAREVMIGGVNSPVRAFGSVGGAPVVFASAKGSRMIDVDGKEYIDYIGSWGPLILGHADPEIVAGVQQAAEKGTSFGATSEIEIALCETIVDMVPSIEKVRLVNSGTEATMSAIRAARGFTGRNKIIKFQGCYHGHGDAFLIAAGSGALTHGVPDSEGVTPGVAGDTLTARFNDPSSVKSLIDSNPGSIAAIIIEPVAGNMGVVPPDKGFLEALRDLCSKNGIVLIFDEVMTGFRVGPGGAQLLYGVEPDLTTLGKIIGGGLPVGAYGGRGEIMDKVSPNGPVYQAGTLSGNPLAATAGYITLRRVQEKGFYEELERKSARLEQGFNEIIQTNSLPMTINRVGSMMTVFFTQQKVVDFESAKSCDTERFAAYFRQMLDRGIFLPPSQFEALFVSIAHSVEDIERTIEHAALIISKYLDFN